MSRLEIDVVVAAVAVVASFAVAGATGWFRCVAEGVLRRAARLLPPGERERWLAEWLAEMEAKPGRGLGKLTFALSVAGGAPVMARDARARAGTRSRRRFAALAVGFGVAFVCLSVTSALGSGNPGPIPLLRVGLTSPNSTLDPARSQGVSPFPAFERLLALGPDGSLHPQLATSVTRPGPNVYVYHLRHGVRFWDGNVMTSADVVNSLNYERYPTSQNAGFFSSVKSIYASGPYTVVVALKHPDASWKYTLGFFGYIFEKRFQDTHETTMGQPGVLIQATGAWKIDSFDPTKGAELSANPHWWGGKVPIQHISFRFFSDEQSMALAFRGGDIDLATPGDGRAFASSSGGKVISAPARFTPGMVSLNVKQPPWNDVHVRRAAAYAINRSDIIAAGGGNGTPLYTFIPPQQLRAVGSQAAVNALLKSLPSYPFDLAKAKAEMAKSAYPNGFTASTDTTQIGLWPNITQAVAGDLQKIGINLKVNVIPLPSWEAEIFGDKAKLGLLFFTDGPLPNPDPSVYPGQLLGSKNVQLNFASWGPPEVDQLIATARANQNPAKRLQLYGQLLRRLALDVPFIPLYLSNSNLALSSKLSWPTWAGYEFTGVLPADWALGIKAR
jgi:peptide/nickel transport system substrate-binding protein